MALSRSKVAIPTVAQKGCFKEDFVVSIGYFQTSISKHKILSSVA